jgi:nucleoside-diphosphate-sugar epimerase
MKVVVTGAESFVGRTLVPLLLETGNRVFSLDIVEPGLGEGLALDIRSRDLGRRLPKGFDALIHLAAVSRDVDCAADPRLAFDVNVAGTANVVAAAQEAGIGQVILASTEWVYGDVSDVGAQSEETIIDVRRVLNEYAATKLAGEMAVDVAVRRGLPSGTVLRFGIIYGPRPGNWSAVESLVNNVRTQHEVVVGSRATARRFVHVRDIASGIVAALGLPGFEIFNLAGGDLVTLGRIIDLSCEVSGRRPRIVEREPSAASVRNPISAKAERVLGWRAETTIEAGVAELNAYFAEALERT